MGRKRGKKKGIPMSMAGGTLQQHLLMAARAARNLPGSRGKVIRSFIEQALVLEAAVDVSEEALHPEHSHPVISDLEQRARQLVSEITERQRKVKRMVPRGGEEKLAEEVAAGSSPGEDPPAP